MALVRAPAPGRAQVLNRIVAGLGGGYAVAAAAAFALPALLPGAAVETVVAAQLIAYVLFVLVALWSFVPRRGAHVWAGILVTAGALLLAGLMGSGPG
ncbi:hypothetical protein [Novosphingobium beihaiensis]|uniref:Iron transporter n=1 Tax=Novosphingobium beihaiensis TaxID=2930389 RepID=A0ABT0BUC4_9SPHN|nr:hypothetical protein [Novosphingobium beihaiensis]MCJ2188279.1 hypothetical protein [Novosphingobium beihaiensis]